MPLMVAGPWEGDDPFLGKGAQIGILFRVSAVREVQFRQGEVVGDISARPRLSPDFYFYQRVPGDDDGSGFGAARTIAEIPSSSWDGRRLQVEFKGDRSSRYFALADLALDLTFSQEQQAWMGNYTRGGVTKRVRLERPGASLRTQTSPFVGTWSFYTGPRSATCVSIAQGADRSFLAWEHSSFLYRVGTDDSASTGILWDDAGLWVAISVRGDTVTLDEFGYRSDRELRRFIGRLSTDGTQIEGKFDESIFPPQWRSGNEGESAVMIRTPKGSTSLISDVPTRAGK